jgi:hypothetical protein
MTTLLALKDEVEERLGAVMKMVFAGATEAHLIAAEISTSGHSYSPTFLIYLLGLKGKARVGVILNPARPFPATWDDRRMYARAS